MHIKVHRSIDKAAYKRKLKRKSESAWAHTVVLETLAEIYYYYYRTSIIEESLSRKLQEHCTSVNFTKKLRSADSVRLR